MGAVSCQNILMKITNIAQDIGDKNEKSISVEVMGEAAILMILKMVLLIHSGVDFPQ